MYVVTGGGMLIGSTLERALIVSTFQSIPWLIIALGCRSETFDSLHKEYGSFALHWHWGHC